MFRAFDGLQSLDKDTKDKIVEKFLSETVLKQEGWNKHEVYESGKNKKLDLVALKNGISKYADFGELKMYPSELIDQEVEKKVSAINFLQPSTLK
jgi:hypothetical protein